MTQQPFYYEYRVRPGDTFPDLITIMYGPGVRHGNYSNAKDYLLAINPEIKDANQLRAGQIVRIGEFPPANAINHLSRTDILEGRHLRGSLNGGAFITQQVAASHLDQFWALAWLEHHNEWLTTPGGIAIGSTKSLLTQGNINLLNEVGEIYAKYKAGKLTKGQYDAKRRTLLTRFKQNIGPVERLLFGEKTTHQAIRIARAGGIPATANIARNVQRINQLAHYGKMGGYVLTGVGVAASCMQIAHTDDKVKKNEIFVDAVATTIVSAAAGYALGLFLVSNPIGWGTALVITVVASGSSYWAGKGVAKVYDSSFRQYDVVGTLGVDKVCR